MRLWLLLEDHVDIKPFRIANSGVRVIHWVFLFCDLLIVPVCLIYLHIYHYHDVVC